MTSKLPSRCSTRLSSRSAARRARRRSPPRARTRCCPRRCARVWTRADLVEGVIGGTGVRTSTSTVSMPSTCRAARSAPTSFDACAEQPAEVRRLRERVPDLEHTNSGTQPREHPGNLRPRARRCRPLPEASGWARRAPSRRARGHRVVELAHAFRLLARRELVDQESRARESPLPASRVRDRAPRRRAADGGCAGTPDPRTRRSRPRAR